MGKEYVYEQWFFDNMLKAYLDNYPWTMLRLKHIEKLVQPGKGEKIIDLGCASGAISHFCSTFGAKVVGVDLSEIAIKTAKRAFANTGIIFLNRNVGKLAGIEDNYFDKAVSADLVEHVKEQDFQKMCQEVHRVLKNGGTFSIYTPNPLHLIELLKKWGVLKQNASHIALRTMEELSVALEKNGFSIELAYFAPSHFWLWNILERLFMCLPLIGKFFGYRICLRARK